VEGQRDRSYRDTLTTAAVLSMILALAAALRVWGWEYGLPHPRARPDEEFVLGDVFQMFAQNRWVPYRYTYPSLPIYVDVVALRVYYYVGQLLGHYDRILDMLFDIVVLRPGLHFRIVRTVSIVLGVGTVLATYFVALFAWGKRRVALLAALVTACSLLHVITSRFGTVDCMMAFFVCWSLAFAVKAARDRKLSSFVLAGILGGLATSSKYNAGTVCMALILPVVAAMFSIEQRQRWPLFGKLVLAGVSMCLTFAVTSPYVILSYEASLKEFAHIAQNLRGGSEVAILVHLRDTFRLGLGWPVYLAALAGVVRGLWRRQPVELAMLGLLIPYMLMMVDVRVAYPRYVVPLVPVLAALSADIVMGVVARFRPYVAVLAASLLVTPTLWSSVQFDRLAAQKDTRILATDWLGENIERRAKIAVCEGYGAPKVNSDRRRPPAFEPIEIECAPPDVRDTGARYLITHEHPAFAQSLKHELQTMLAEEWKMLVRIDPFHETSSAIPFFFRSDIFYLPMAGFDALERGGPIITVWALDAVDDGRRGGS